MTAPERPPTDSTRTRSREDVTSWLALGLSLLFAVFAVVQLVSSRDVASRGPAEEFVAPIVPAVASAAAEPLVVKASHEPVAVAVVVYEAAASDVLALITTEGTLRRGETLGQSLGRQGISAGTVHTVATEMSPVFNFRYAKPGDRYVLTQSDSGEVLRFEYQRSEMERYYLIQTGSGYRAEAFEPVIERRRARIAGVVTTSLYDAIDALGEYVELANDFAEIFAWDVDFTRAVQSGDEFRILYERRFLVGDDGSERYIGPGRILAARYATAGERYDAMYYELEEGRGGYYRLDGSSVERQFLRAPLKYRRVSSGYSANRLHPILKVRRPHYGIDYAAASGTPVWSVADGTVIFRGVMGGFGKTVKVRHTNGYVSYYGHLSRFPRELKVGQKLRQKQIVGFVGSTGPHLDFRLKHNGRYVNPAALRTPAGDPIPAGRMPSYEQVRDALLLELDPTPLRVATGEAG